MGSTIKQRFFAFTVTFLLAGSCQAESAEWKVGLAQLKITPEQPVFLDGYASRNKPYSKIESDLYVKALVLEDSAGHRAVLVTSDLIGYPAEIAEPICARLEQKLGLKRDRILINSSHIHTGPALSLDPQARGSMSAEDARRTVAYTVQLQDRTVAVVEQAAARLEPASLSVGSGVIHFAMNRRQFTPNGVVLGANPRGLADRSVPLLRIDAPDGKTRCLLFGAAVHNTTLRGQSYEVCGDYAGFAQEYVQDKLPGVQAMFMLGCAGDADPYPHGSMELARRHGAELGAEVCRVAEGKLQPVRGPLRVAFAQIDLPLQKAPPPAELAKLAEQRGIQSWVAQQMLERLNRGEKLPTSYRCPQTVWQFGDDLTLVALSGEVTVDYVTLLEQALGPNKLWIAAYSNDVYGYLPSARVLREGGYETRGLYRGGIGLFDPRAETALIDAIRQLAAEAGRKVLK